VAVNSCWRSYQLLPGKTNSKKYSKRKTKTKTAGVLRTNKKAERKV